MKAGVRNSHHHSTAGAGTWEKGNNKTKNSILKIVNAVAKLEEENLETFASSPLAIPCHGGSRGQTPCRGSREAIWEGRAGCHRAG